MRVSKQNLQETVRKIVFETPIFDFHTHIYDTRFGDLLLWGVDELLVYHYLVAEFFRYSSMSTEEFFAQDKKSQAERIWQALFIEHSPVSESNRGVLTCLRKLGLDTAGRDLESFRAYFAALTTEQYVDKVFEVANIEAVVMTNDPFDDLERPVWLDGKGGRDKRFHAALRIDPILMDWDNASVRMTGWGYEVTTELTDKTISEIRRFLKDWIVRMNPLYMAVSLPPSFIFPDGTKRSEIIEKCIVPVTREAGIPFAMMIGVKKLTNPKLGLAGDCVGRADLASVEELARRFPDNKFFVTFLSRENQHEACIVARKFANVMLFGCWWFMNNPSIIREITAERIELLGTSFIPQHSDARVLDQLLYKWEHSRILIADILSEKYADIIDTGWQVSEEEIRRDVENFFGGNAKKFLGIK